MYSDIEIMGCAKKHGSTDMDIRSAIKNCIAARYRNFDIPCQICFAGSDLQGRLIEVLGAELEGNKLIVYHAMPLTRKMAFELGLGDY